MSESSTSILLPAAGAVSDPVKRLSKRRVDRRLLSRIALISADIGLVLVNTLLASELLKFAVASDGLRPWSPTFAAAASLAVLIPTAMLGLYDTAALSPLERFRMRVYVAAIFPWLTLAFVSIIEPINLGTLLDLGVVSTFFVPLSLLGEACIRQMLISHAAWGADVVVVGSGESIPRIVDYLLAHPEVGLRPVAYCGDLIDGEATRELPYLGPVSEIGRAAHAADIAVVAMSPELGRLDIAHLPFGRIVMVPNISGVPVVPLRLCTLGGAAGFDFLNPGRVRSHHHAKRMVDLLVSMALLVLAIPVVLCTAVIIWLISPGPVFYIQRRVGWHGRPIRIYKLRSMYLNAERRLETLLQTDAVARGEWNTYMKLSRDPRILPIVGNIIRRTSIDELPQLWNVLRGDMSLIGPRPFPAYHVEKFSPAFQRLRCCVRPGLSGLWQVSARNDADLQQQEAIDTFYIRNWSLWLDFYIMFRTLPAVLIARGAK